MKSLLNLILLIVLGLAAASQTPEQVESELLSYVQSQVASVVGRPSLGRSGGGLACYDKYIPLISAATSNSKTETETCNNLATTRREDELNKVKDESVTLNNQVATVQGTLSSCSNQTDALDFLTCLKDNSALLQSTIEQVTKSATSLADGLSGAYTTIDNAENLCIQKVMDKVKSETDTLTTALQSCLLNGFDVPQPEDSSSTSEAASSSTESSVGPQSSTSSPADESSSSSLSDGSNFLPSSSSSGNLIPDYDLLPEEPLY